MKRPNHDEFKTLLEKYIKKECSPEELHRLELYLQQTTNQDILPSMEEVKELLGTTYELPAESAARIKQEILANKPKSASKVKQLAQTRNHKRRTYIQWAAAACFLGLITTSLWWFNNSGIASEPTVVSKPSVIELRTASGEVVDLSGSDLIEVQDAQGSVVGTKHGDVLTHAPLTDKSMLEYNTITIPHAKRFQLELSDGSIVHLNANSSLRYPINFIPETNRKVYLSGEAYFEVAPDQDHPFVVHTDKLAIKVLGTQFNVQAYPEIRSENVILVEGKVAVRTNHGQNVLMDPNEQLSIDGQNLKTTAVNALEVTSWKDGYLTVNSTELKQVISQLETYYNIDISSSDNANQSIGSGKIYLSRNIETIMTTLSLLTKSDYSFEPRKN